MARSRLELLARHAAVLFVARVSRIGQCYEKNRNPFWSGAQFSAGVCRTRESENGRQRYRRGIRQDRQGGPGRAMRLRRGDRSHLAGRAVLSRLAQKRGARRNSSREQSFLVER